MKKRILSMLIAIVMVLGLVPAFSLTAVASETITPRTPHKISAETAYMLGFENDGWKAYDGYYAIRDASELYGFAELVNGGNLSANAVLLQNITINSKVSASGATYSWTPIGVDDYYGYVGTFDGGGHTISGLYCNMPDTTGVGLFGFIGTGFGNSTAVIKNVILLNSYIRGKEFVGGIVGAILGYNNRIENCMVSSNVTVTIIKDYYPSDFKLGGIAGGHLVIALNKTSYINNCVSFAAVEGIALDSDDLSDYAYVDELEFKLAGTCIGAIVGEWNISGSNAGMAVTVSDCYYLKDATRVYDPDNDTWCAYANYGEGGMHIPSSDWGTNWGRNTGSTALKTVSDSHTCIEVTNVSIANNCTYYGYDAYKFCLICDNYYGGERAPISASHKYSGATCSDKGVCTVCGDTNGAKNPNVHTSFIEATCMYPKTCTDCGATEGGKNSSNHVSDEGYVYSINSGDSLKHDVKYSQCGAFVVTESHTYNENGACTKCTYKCNHSYSYTNGSCSNCGYKCKHTSISNNKCTVCGAAGSYSYIDRVWNSTIKKVDETVKLATPAIQNVTAETTEMKDGWYIVEGTVKLTENIKIKGTVHLILADNSLLTKLRSSDNISLQVCEGSAFYIYSQSDSDSMGAIDLGGISGGITGEQSIPVGDIIINGGNITAKSNSSRGAAAIGGYMSSGGNITINGGIVNAIHSDRYGAGIGGGCTNFGANTGGNITINGGIVNAQGGEQGAGIGGCYGGDGGNITINGGTVTAKGGYNSAGIGGSNGGDGGNITINGGTVVATRGANGRGIGGGKNGDGATLVITGGNVKTDSIGKGYEGDDDGTVTDGRGNDISLHTIILSGASDGASVTNVSGFNYGFNDVKTLDTDKLYFWLPSAPKASSIAAGGTEYICNNNLTYITEHDFSQNDSMCATCGLCTHAEFENGFCAMCKADNYYQSATLTTDKYDLDGDEVMDEVYEIGNAGQLYWFARLVNIEGKTRANAILTADIDIEGRTWYAIGLYNDIAEENGALVQKRYGGMFDGNGHTVSNFVAVGNGSQGLFGYCEFAAKIVNLGVINATVSGWNAGAIVGYTSTVYNCYAINCTIIGKSNSNTSAVTISSIGANNGSNNKITNSYAYGCTLIVGEGEESYVMHPLAGINATGNFVSNIQNSYYGGIFSESEFTRTDSATEKSSEQFANGEVAYLLGDAWGQTIGVDAYPVIGGARVYVGRGGSYTNEKPVVGDVDGDGFVTNSDVLEIYKHIYDPVTYPIDAVYADIDCDGFVTNADVLEVYKHIYDPINYPIG